MATDLPWVCQPVTKTVSVPLTVNRVTYNVVAVREIEARDVHASVEHLDEHVGVPAGRAKRADNLGLAVVEVNLLENVLEANVA